MSSDHSFRCYAVTGSDLPSASAVSASALLVPEALLTALAIALGDPIELRTDSFVCIGPCQLQPYASAASGDQIIVIASVPYRGHHDLPPAPLSQVSGTVRALRAIPVFEADIRADGDLPKSPRLQSLICCQRLVVRPGSVFTFCVPGRGSILCSTADCRPSAGVITRRTAIRLSICEKFNNLAANILAWSACEAVLGPAYSRLCSFLRLPKWRPRGILFHGASGNGKSLVVDAAVAATNSSIRRLSGHDLAAMPSPGDAERVLSDAFSDRVDVVCIDAIEQISGKRGSRVSTASRILGQLLTLMTSGNGRDVVVIGITTSTSTLDPALRRAGRFDHEIEVSAPDIDQRDAILRFFFQGWPTVLTRSIAERCVGYNGSDLHRVANECALSAAFQNRIELIPDDVEVAFSRVGVSSSRKDATLFVQPTQWSDIGGYDDIKSALQRMIQWPIKHPEEYRRMGLRLPRGFLLYGPPGCCKTTLARALVSSSSDTWSILKLDSASVYSSFVGDAEAAIRRTFTQARANVPCMLLLDEIDAIVTRRGLQGSESDRVQERILSTLLNEMDGISGADRILVVASTNRPHLLDSALLRPGRFDHLFYVGLPDAPSRVAILKVHTRSMPLDSALDLELFARVRLENYTGAEIENVCREAALNVLRSNMNGCVVTPHDFDVAANLVRPGLVPDFCEIYHDFANKGMV